MAEKIKENQFDTVGVNPFNAPIPGESLTSSPENPKAWERPPQYSEEDEAMMAVYMELTELETLQKLVSVINEGIALDEIAQVILYKGYTEGKFTPDMILLLAEPTIYLLIAIADYAEIDDYVLYEGENDMDAEIVEFIVNENSKVLDKKIMDLDFPLTAIIGGVIRNNQGIIALGDFEIQLGDRVLVCSKPESIKKVESLFL